MPSSLWEDIKKTVKEGFSTAAEKTEEYTKIGKLKVDILNIKRNIDKTFTDLGRDVYSLSKGAKKSDVTKNEKVIKQINQIDELKAKLKAKEAEIDTIRKESASKENSDSKPEPTNTKGTDSPKTRSKNVKK